MMKTLRTLIRKIPGTVFLYRKFIAWRYLFLSEEEIFTRFYKKNHWGSADSRSGPGSDLSQTRVLISTLPVIFREFNISSMLDIPCGDFFWMKEVDLKGIAYHGADIVAPLIDENKRLYHDKNLHFSKLNLLTDNLPPVSLIFCRDCLVHFSYKDIQTALRNMIQSNSEYLLTTTFDSRTQNSDIITGEWRPLNLQAPPFGFPAPLFLLDEQCTEGDGIYTDKKMGLWRISDLIPLVNAMN